MLWSECKSLAEGFLHRTDLNLDSLQPLVISDINLGLVVQENEAGGSITLADGGNGLWFAPLPADYSMARAVDIDGAMCDPVDYRTLKQHGAGRRWYAISGMSLFATRAGQADVLYTKRLAPDGNAVLDRYPQIYLYGLLKHAAIVVQDTDMAQIYAQQFGDHVDVANGKYQDMAFGPGMGIAAVPGGIS